MPGEYRVTPVTQVHDDRMNAYSRAEAVKADIESLGVRPIYMEDISAIGRLGGHAPRRREWAARRPQHISQQIQELLAEDQVSLRLFALNEAAMHRRELVYGRLTGFAAANWTSGTSAVHHAEVVGVTDVEVGRNRRTLPVLHLMEFCPWPEGEPVISLPDLAYGVQSGQVELRLTQA